jgi:hypothetical protein
MHLFTLILKRLSRVRMVRDALDGGWLDVIPLTLMRLRFRSCWRLQTGWRDLLSLRVWLMSSGGTEVPTGSTPRSPAILACSVEIWPWRERSRSRRPVLRPSVGFLYGLYYLIGAGLRT